MLKLLKLQRNSNNVKRNYFVFTTEVFGKLQEHKGLDTN